MSILSNILRARRTNNVFTTIIGRGVIMIAGKLSGNDVYVRNDGKISIGTGVWLNSYPNGCIFRTALNTYLPEATIVIGNRCKINGTIIHANELVEIGEDVRIGPGTVICDNDSHRVALSVEDRAKSPASAPICIEENVWIGMNCIVLKGVTIGKNTIIAAGSVVTKNCENNSMYAGNPAKFIKKIEE